ncbi:MAG: hypothetical protein HDR26_10445 [Lachnospiraceae bacterium]|nr:hypothetical protein [Lachnospiraceae bacterium]
MKRLNYFITNMKPASETYEEMYEGKLCETPGDCDPIVHNHAMYWDDEIGYEITKSNRLELSRPTVTVHIPLKLLRTEETCVAARDYIFRAFIPYIRTLNEQNDNRKRTAKENGHYYIYEPDHKVLDRNVVSITRVPQKYYRIISGNTIAVLDDHEHIPAYLCVSLMLQVQLPEGKHKKARQMLIKDLPEAVNRFVEEFDREGLKNALTLYEKQETIRKWLRENGCCAFVANGSILPRQKDGDLPLSGAVPFLSVRGEEAEVAGVKGMLFKKGVTVITGGGYSGKSTLLDALSAGIYNHIEGDGRELVITEPSAMKISAEDGRSVRHVNLSPFIKWIPGGDPGDFSTNHASGSTSQAANVMEAVGWGVKLLLIDEDKSATNFMIQDPVMKELIEKEPITPFVDRVRELAETKGVSTILVIGGSSEYLRAADRIFMMKDYRIEEVTNTARELQSGYFSYNKLSREARQRLLGRENVGALLDAADFSCEDRVDANRLSVRPAGSSTEVMRVSELGFLILGEEQVDIRMLHNIASIPQLNAIAFLVRRLINQVNPLERFQKFSGESIMGDAGRETEEECACRWIRRKEEVERLLEEVEREGLESVYSTFFTECGRWMDMPRKYEILAVLSRMRLTPEKEQ